MLKQRRKVGYIPSDSLTRKPFSLFSDVFVGIYHDTVCLSHLITRNQDSRVFVIPMYIFSSPPAKLSTRQTFDVCENEASRILINSLKATELLHGKFSFF